MNKSGEVVQEEKDSFGFKAPIEIIRPDMCIVLDECGCNLSQEGDGNVGRERFLTSINNKAYRSVSTKHQHFTHIG